MHRQVFLAPSRRRHPSVPGLDAAARPLKKPFLALAGAAALLLGCQDGSGTAPGGLEPSQSSVRSETDRGTPGARSGSDFSGEPAVTGGGPEAGSGSGGSADEVSRDSGSGTGAETSPGDGSDGGSGGATN